MSNKEKAKLKTLADYALILHLVNGYTKSEAREAALESEEDELFEELLERNLLLIEKGEIKIF